MTPPKYSKYTVHDTWGHRLLRGLCSCLVPGTGQLLGGARKRGYILIGTTVAIIAALVLVVLSAVENVDQLLAWLLSPSNLLALLIIDVVLVAFRLYAVADAVWLRRTRWGAVTQRPEQGGEVQEKGPEGVLPGIAKWKRLVAIAGLVVLFAFTVFPHAWVGYQYVWKFRDLLSTVFAPPTTTTTIATTTTLVDSGTTISTEPANTTTTVAPVKVDAGADGRLTILFIGADVDETRAGVARNDTTIVASFDMNTGRIALFSLPRNAGNVPLSKEAQKALGVKVYPNLLNALYQAAWKVWRIHPELAPEGGDPGAEVVRDMASIVLGIPIDYYAVINMLGLVNLVDAMGGVDIYFDKPLHMGISSPTEKGKFLYFDAVEGINHLSGIQGLAYARTRKDKSDYVRMGRQRCLIAALMDQTGTKELVWNFPGIMDVVKNMVRTDIPISALQELVKLRSKLKTDKMISIGFIEPRYTRGTAGNPILAQNGWVLNQKLIQSTVKQILENPDQFVPEKAGADKSDCWKKPQGQ